MIDLHVALDSTALQLLLAAATQAMTTLIVYRQCKKRRTKLAKKSTSWSKSLKRLRDE